MLLRESFRANKIQHEQTPDYQPCIATGILMSQDNVQYCKAAANQGVRRLHKGK